MSSFSRRSFLVLAAAGPLLAGCGFTPTYGTDGKASGLLGQVIVDEPNDNNTYLLGRELEDRLGRVSSGNYGLSIAVVTEERSTGKTISGVTSRYDVVGDATFALRDLSSGQVLTSGKARNYTGYSATGTSAATLAAQDDAYERLMVILTDQIMASLWAWSAKSAT
ncbi:LPS-assembly lipoprotein [Shimia gijangensis]|uniref:LPS-assembly lipoprotein n=1 Tax=Shimia gijangensis TaxID=1470563 RepID=A0A1M6NNB3_9RHOB|nr:LPS assembly lipoprotein LptE [Shimia gijangensis]SHJ97221.1 LPS-assembly lipoprotein [Shimia gijangensis]